MSGDGAATWWFLGATGPELAVCGAGGFWGDRVWPSAVARVPVRGAPRCLGRGPEAAGPSYRRVALGLAGGPGLAPPAGSAK